MCIACAQAGFVSLVRETWDLVQPVMRLGVPNNSLRDKLPYFRCGSLHAEPAMMLATVLTVRALVWPSAPTLMHTATRSMDVLSGVASGLQKPHPARPVCACQHTR